MDPSQPHDAEINEAVEFCCSCWGGRINGFYPVVNGAVPEQWWNALLMLDPDFICSYVPIGDDLLWKINRHILPVEILDVSPPGDSRSFFWGFSSLSLQSADAIPPFIWGTRGYPNSNPLFAFLSSQGRSSPSVNFSIRNFGTLPRVVRIEESFRDLPQLAFDVQNTPPSHILQNLRRTESRIILPVDIGRTHAYFPAYLNHHPFAEGLHIVVGDSPLDFMYSWNRGQLCMGIPGQFMAISRCWRNTLWIPPSLTEDSDLMDEVFRWVGDCVSVRDFMVPNKLVSYSVPVGHLTELAERFRKEIRRDFEAHALTLETYPFPAGKGIPVAVSHQTEQIPISDGKGISSIPQPPFALGRDTGNGWMLDLGIQCHPERFSAYTNVRPEWQLPKRVGIAHRFLERGMHGVRVLANGHPSVFVRQDAQNVVLTIPSDIELLWPFLEKGIWNHPRSPRLEHPYGRFKGFSISDQGSALKGIIDLFGNLYSCSSTLEKPFWRRLFMMLSGRTRNKDNHRSAILAHQITEYLASAPCGVAAENEDAIAHLADFLAGRPLEMRANERHVSKDELKKLHDQWQDDAQGTPEEGFFKQAWLDDIILRQLVERGVLQQGVDARCPSCRSTGFYHVDNLSQVLRCRGCLRDFPLTPSPQWRFRLNDLVRNALGYQGVLPLVEVLHKMTLFHSDMAIYMPCQNIYEGARDEIAFTDIDLILMKGGQLVIGEVKSKPTSFQMKDFEKMTAISEEIQPHELVFAAPGTDWPDEILAEISKVRERMLKLEIKVTDLHLTWSVP